ncbi:hypothetical protein SAMN02745172_02477 [Pseudoxanthobacter soli DSM 19599]|uniref:NrS-1 polymerase-like helicase domain-containing protein n=1 Tax=Pseudoxanthobacter soli DSM 19599 TaxID=1123029 RepID=A0A1M7ZLQ4_9HYPH|nr:primase-helicase family protein [Pseudoxanthobacter soli]SHO65830.1 hypothetical protein SAMN02745172_02477 [Pseudoxanthobacter soli DSM 19599]
MSAQDDAGDNGEGASPQGDDAPQGAPPKKPKRGGGKAKPIADAIAGAPVVAEPGGVPFDIDAWNREYAVIVFGGATRILWEHPEQRDPVFMSADSFFLKNLPKVTYKPLPDGGLSAVQTARMWIRHRQRREYDGLTFHPLAPGEAPPDTRLFNYWTGWAVAPDPTKSCAPFLDHLLENWCGGSMELFDFIVGWMAHMVQRPRERITTAIAVRGHQGAGKSIVGEILGELMPRHFFQTYSARYLLSNFNAHFRGCLLAQADESVWAGDKASEGTLKGLVRAENHMVELKGVDAVPVPNYMRLMLTTNNDWVVPAGKEERAFAVFDVGDRRIRDSNYFSALRSHMREGGGLAGLLAYLMAVDLSRIDLRDVPETRALYEQKVHSLDPIDSFWLERLREGAQLPGDGHWRPWVPTHRLISAYYAAADRVGIRRKSDETSFGIKLRRIVPDLRRTQGYDTDDISPAARRLWGYAFPSLEDARAAYAAAMRSTIDWEGEDL